MNTHKKNKGYSKLYKQIVNKIIYMYSLLLNIYANFYFIKEIHDIATNISNQIFSLFDTSHFLLNLFPKNLYNMVEGVSIYI